MAGRREENRKAVLADIKATCCAIIDETGDIAAVSINGVARKVGLTPPALYSYFKNRDALIASLVLDFYREFIDELKQVDGASKDGAPGEYLFQVLSTWRQWSLDNPVIYKLLTSRVDMDRIRAVSPEVTASFNELTAFFTLLFGDLVLGHDLDIPPIGADTAAAYAGIRARIEARFATPVPAEVLHFSLQTVSMVHGLITFELAQRMYDFVDDPDLLFACQVTEQIRKIIPDYKQT